jgi:hypothetical protein
MPAVLELHHRFLYISLFSPLVRSVSVMVTEVQSAFYEKVPAGRGGGGPALVRCGGNVYW